MAASFQRARSDEQRALRRQAILDAAAAMLEEMPVADVSLNELSRRVGLAKSNVLRYFDSREGVLLDLLAASVDEWIADMAGRVPTVVRRRTGFPRRAEQLAEAIAASLGDRPVLCDLMSAQAAVLERNVSVEAVTRYKLAGLDQADAITRLVREALPELDEETAFKYTVGIWLAAASLWGFARPPEAVVEAYATEERLGRTLLDFRTALADHLTTLAIGLHARAG